MKPWLFLPHALPHSGEGSQILSLFLAAPVDAADELEADLVFQLRELGPVSSIYVLGFDEAISSLRRVLADPHSLLLSRLEQVTNQHADGLLFFSFDPIVGRHLCSDRKGALVNRAAQRVDEERRASLRTLFLRSGGEERAPAGTHYAKTSERHCDRFLRVSNVLEDGLHVQLVAFWLIGRLWSKSTDHVVVDTSHIYSVVLTTLEAASRLGGLKRLPRVWSHRSHEGVDAIPPRVAAAAQFVVSASTSNGLVRKLLERGAQAGDVTTLFSLSDDPITGHEPLCDLRGEEPLGLKPIQNQDAASCRWCRENLHLISIRGDQFSIAPPLVRPVELLANDLNEKMKPVLSSMAGLGAFFAYRRRDDERICSLGVDVSVLIGDTTPAKSEAWLKRIREKWAAAVSRAQTLSLRHIVACSYPQSRLIAKRIQADAAKGLADASTLKLLESRELRETPSSAGAAAVVVSACIDEPQELLGVSRTLRDVQEGGAISYLSVVQLLAPTQLAARLRSNLTFGAHGPATFSLATMQELVVDAYEPEPSWRAEQHALQRLRSWVDAQDLDLPAEVDARLRRLLQAPSQGLRDDLFWPDHEGRPLRLRSDFTLIDGSLQAPTASQADLYAVFCVVLTGLRHTADSSRRLAHNAYERGVLSPANFDRFTDGVLQACLLRAARPKELAYGACDDVLSEQMLGVLMNALPQVGRLEKSEALVEFLLALATRRMSLAPAHLQKFLGALVPAATESWPLVALLGRFLQATQIQSEPGAPTAAAALDG